MVGYVVFMSEINSKDWESEPMQLSPQTNFDYFTTHQ